MSYDDDALAEIRLIGQSVWTARSVAHLPSVRRAVEARGPYSASALGYWLRTQHRLGRLEDAGKRHGNIRAWSIREGTAETARRATLAEVVSLLSEILVELRRASAAKQP